MLCVGCGSVAAAPDAALLPLTGRPRGRRRAAPRSIANTTPAAAVTITYEQRKLSVQMGVRSSEMKLALVLLLASSTAFADPVTLTPVAMDGPYKSQHEACLHAKPCAGTQVDAKESFKFVK